MLNTILTKVIGTKNERELKAIRPLVQRINALEPPLLPLSDYDLRSRTTAFRELQAQGASLDELLPDGLAVVREAGRRGMNMRHFDFYLIGGLIRHRGTIS